MQFGISGSVLFLPASGTLPIMVGGFGYGTEMRAAYDGPIDPTFIKVTNLNDSGNGSLRAACEAAFPRIVIFETSGYVNLNSDIIIQNPYINIWGATAPSPGICLRNGGIWVWTHHVYCEGLAIRYGTAGPLQPQTAGYDCTQMYAAFAPSPGVNFVVFDHMSLGWAPGKLANLDSVTNPTNCTYWRCLLSEALYRAPNVIVSTGQPSSLALSLSPAARMSVIQNIISHSSDRNPEVHQETEVIFLNNIVYDWGRDDNPYPWASLFYGSGSLGNPAVPWKADFVGNKYIAGSSTHPSLPLYAIGTYSGAVGCALYMTDNSVTGATLNYNNMTPDPRTITPPISLTGFTQLASSGIEAFLIDKVGARPLDRDFTDNRIISQLTNRNGVIISDPSEVGGFPSRAVNTRSLTVPSNPHAVGSSGYRLSEEWYHTNYYAVVNGG